jgi:hypothetical protein
MKHPDEPKPGYIITIPGGNPSLVKSYKEPNITPIRTPDK